MRWMLVLDLAVGMIVKEHFDELQKIWSGSSSVSALPIGLSSLQSDQNVDDESAESKEDQDVTNDVEEEDRPMERPRNIEDNKRKNLRKQISAHQRELMMIGIAEKELKLKEKSIDVLQKSLEQSDMAIRVMSESIVQVGNCMKEGDGSTCPVIQFQSNVPTTTFIQPICKEYLPKSPKYAHYEHLSI